MLCSKGHIMRRGYTRRDGTYVKPACIVDRGNVGKGPALIGPLRKGTLSQFGYSADASQAQRRHSLSMAIDEYGTTVVIRKLNAVCILNKNTNPAKSARFCLDKKWVMGLARRM